MTALRIQKMAIDDCEQTILRNYFDWGRGNATDSQEPSWDDADEATRAMLQRRGYDFYDGYPAQPGNDIGAAEIFVSVGINSRVILNDACRLLARAEPARPLLARIPDDACLEHATDDQLDAAAELLKLLEEAEYIGRGKVTKVLHKKRPAFIPVIDSVVGDFLWKCFPWVIDGAATQREVLTLFRTLLVGHSQALVAVRAHLATQGFRLTTVRVLDYLLWLGWRNRVDKFGFGLPITDVWKADGIGEAREKARQSWEAQRHSDGTTL